MHVFALLSAAASKAARSHRKVHGSGLFSEARKEAPGAAAGRGRRGHRRPAPPAHAPPSTTQQPGDELGCSHFEACSGCTLHSGLDNPPVLQAARAFFEQHGTKLEMDAGPAQHWRHRARLAVQPGPGGRAVIGLFRQGTHQAVDIPHCVAHHPGINATVEVARRCITACGVMAYNETSGAGELRYLQLTVVGGEAGGAGPASASASVQVVLVWNSAPGAPSTARLQRLGEALWQQAGPPGPRQPALLHSVWANFQPAQTNTILGPDWQCLHGPELTWARLGGADVCFAPGSFLQVNFGAMDRCLQAMQRFVPPGAAILDMFSGVGIIGLSLAATRRPRWVRFVEVNPLAEAPFQHSAARLQEHWASQAQNDSNVGNPPQLEYHVAEAGSDPGRWLAGAEAAIVDPPRKGLDPGLLEALCSAAALQQHPGLRRLLYLSCGWPAFQRDCSALLGSGHWRLAHAQAFSFFPATNHIETLAVFDRVPLDGERSMEGQN